MNIPFSIIVSLIGVGTPVARAQQGPPPGAPPLPPGARPPGGPMRLRGYPADFKPNHADVSYASTSKSQILDIFLPEGDGPFPLVINIHGGAFRFGSKEMLDSPVAKAILNEKIAVATLNYRLSGEATFPAAVLDVKAAVRFLRANASKFKLRPDAFVAFGQSAGGNLASMLGTSGSVAEFDDPTLGNPTTSSCVQGVIDWFGPTDFSQMDDQAKAQGCPPSSATHSTPNSPESHYLGAPVPDVPALVAKANPITYITPDDPPFLLQKGEKDCMVPVGQSKLLFDALQSAKVPAAYDLLPGAGHGDMGSSTPKFLSEANIQRVVNFVKSSTTPKSLTPPAQ